MHKIFSLLIHQQDHNRHVRQYPCEALEDGKWRPISAVRASGDRQLVAGTEYNSRSIKPGKNVEVEMAAAFLPTKKHAGSVPACSQYSTRYNLGAAVPLAENS